MAAYRDANGYPLIRLICYTVPCLLRAVILYSPSSGVILFVVLLLSAITLILGLFAGVVLCIPFYSQLLFVLLIIRRTYS